MPVHERSIDRGSQRGRAILHDLGSEVRRARLERGLAQAAVATAAGLSRNQLRRIENGEAPGVPLLILSRTLSVLGLELAARAYPAGPPLRDAAHLRLLQRLHQRLPAATKWSVEVPLPEDHDRRAWDAVVVVAGMRIGIEAETRLRDLQAVVRRSTLKVRDDPSVPRLMLLIADTRHNRLVVRECTATLFGDFPVPSWAAIRALSRGDDPGGNAIVFL